MRRGCSAKVVIASEVAFHAFHSVGSSSSAELEALAGCAPSGAGTCAWLSGARSSGRLHSEAGVGVRGGRRRGDSIDWSRPPTAVFVMHVCAWCACLGAHVAMLSEG